MKNRSGLVVLLTLLAMSTVAQCAHAKWESPLKKYDLYADTQLPQGGGDPNRERVVNDILPTSQRELGDGASTAPSTGLLNSNSFPTIQNQLQNVERRNVVLRESSRRRYSTPGTPAWLEGQSFYANPSLDSIKEKYKKSNFAGCMQEATSYVRLHPSDTLGFYYLAMSYAKVNDRENAIRAYERVISLNANPMIVKYATNGRNCVLGQTQVTDEEGGEPKIVEKCYPNVNEPEIYYPYANIDESVLIPIDPQTLVNRNFQKVSSQLTAAAEAIEAAVEGENGGEGSDENGDKKTINLPFGKQDNDLDAFINAPYGNGLSPKLNEEYKQQQLKSIQSVINTDKDSPETDRVKMDNIKKFDNQKSDLDTIKLAYDPSAVANDEWKAVMDSPEFKRQQQELMELNMMFGNSTSNSRADVTDFLPYMADKENAKLSPEAIQTMMMQSIMGDLSL